MSEDTQKLDCYPCNQKYPELHSEIGNLKHLVNLLCEQTYMPLTEETEATIKTKSVEPLVFTDFIDSVNPSPGI